MLIAVLLFAASLAGVVGGSVLLSRALRAAGTAFDIPEQFLGLMTALGADSPEIVSSITAMVSGQHDVGVGVAFGSILFNLASLLGLTTLLADGISFGRPAVLLNGGVGLAIAWLGVFLVAGIGPAFSRSR